MAEDSVMGVNYTEFLVTRKKDKHIRLIKLFIFLGFLVFSAIMFVIMFVIAKIPVLVIVYIILSMIYFWYFSGYTKIEYEYVIASASMRMETILAQTKRSLLFDVKIKDFSLIAPYRGNEKLYNGEDIEKRIFAASSLDSPDLYIGVFNDENNKKTAVLFDATNKALSIMKFYNSSATEVIKVRY